MLVAGKDRACVMLEVIDDRPISPTAVVFHQPIWHFVMGIIIRLFNVALGSGLILSFLIIVVIYFSKRIRKRSLSMEKQFLENFQGTAGTFPQEEPETGETSTEKNHELSNK